MNSLIVTAKITRASKILQINNVLKIILFKKKKTIKFNRKSKAIKKLLIKKNRLTIFHLKTQMFQLQGSLTYKILT